MELNLANWSQRFTYFLGRFHDLELQSLLARFLRAGDRFVDMGANMGMITLVGSRFVGPSGVVDAFEPNPACFESIRATLARNKITNVRLHPAAMGDVATTLPLTVPRYNSGEASLVAAPDTFGGDADTVEVPVLVGDDALKSDPRPPIFIKIDVEGFERRVLQGLRETLTWDRPLVATEVIARHLAREGCRPSDLFDLMESLGYRGLQYKVVRKRLTYRELTFAPASATNHADNVLWVPDGGPAVERLESLRIHGL